MRRSTRINLIHLAVLGFATASRGFGHSMYQAAVLLDFEGNSVTAELQLPVERLGRAIGRTLDPQTLQREATPVTEYVMSRFHASLPDGRLFSIHLQSPLAIASIDGASYCVVRLALSPPTQANTDQFELSDDVIVDRIPEQVTLVSIRSDWRTSTFANDPKFLGVFRGASRSVTVDRSDASWFQGFSSIFRLGMRHIAEGTDHLLFLLTLLLPAPLLVFRHRWKGVAGTRIALMRILKVVTAFTLGHSITLAVSALGLIQVPGRPIEVLIAVSILVSAVHAFRPIFPGREFVVAGSFGLVHGLAFATTLAELGLGSWERVASIFGFNLGIEVMQLIVVTIAMPPLLLLSRTSIYPALRLTGCIFAGSASIGWIVQRSMNIYNPMDLFIEALSRHAMWLATSLLLLAILAWSGERVLLKRQFLRERRVSSSE